MEIGSFLELQLPKGRELYNNRNDIARLNTGRMGIWHAFRVTGCRRIWIPIYQCDTIRDTFAKKGVEMCFYHQDKNWNPIDIYETENDAVLLVNYFGIMSNTRMAELAKLYKHTIIDCSQAFFCPPVKGSLTVYSCRKFIGVPDGAYVIGKNAHNFIDEYPQCYSSDTSAFLLMRVEYGCEGKGYEARKLNEQRIETEDCMLMSKLTHTLMDAEDYVYNKQKRKENFEYLHERLGGRNLINPILYLDEETVPMVYPFVVENESLIYKLVEAKHFQGHWWGYICDEQPIDTFEHWLSKRIIPLTIDQRYSKAEMDYIVEIINNYI